MESGRRPSIRLTIYSEPSFTAESGQIIVDIAAVDHQQKPVEGATIELEGAPPGDDVFAGKVKEVGDGVYRGVIKTRRASVWTLTASCPEAGVFVHHAVTVTPDKPARIEILGQPDPRVAAPFSEVTLGARLLDRLGNPLDPRRLAASARKTRLKSWAAGEEARFLLRHVGYADVAVEIRDQRSKVRLKTMVYFAAAWLRVPEVVKPGSRYSTAVFFCPSPEKRVREALVEVKFDRKRVAFEEYSSSSGGPELSVSVEPRLKDGLVLLRVRSPRPWTRLHVDRLLASSLCTREDCINLYIIPTELGPGFYGRGSDPPGSVLIDPNNFNGTPNVGAHELAHALGLQHVNDPARLMHRRPPVGRWISDAECERVEEMAANYPCV